MDDIQIDLNGRIKIFSAEEWKDFCKRVPGVLSRTGPTDYAKKMAQDSNAGKQNLVRHQHFFGMLLRESTSPKAATETKEYSIDPSDATVGIRPVIQLTKKEAMQFGSSRSVIFGKFPQKKVDASLNKKLNKSWYQIMYNDDMEVKNMTFSTDVHMRNKNYIVIYQKKPYVRDGDKDQWYKVEDISWYFDEKKNQLISDHILMSGFRMEKGENFFDSKLYHYLNDTFAKEIVQLDSKIKVQEEPPKVEKKINEKTKEVQEIVSEINQYLKYYHGDMDIQGKVNKLIEKYNQDIQSLNKNDSTSTSLNFKGTEETLFISLSNELNQILTHLKFHYDNSKEYHQILDTIHQCMTILQGGILAEDVEKNELVEDIQTLKKDVVPFLNTKGKESVDTLLRALVFDEKEMIEVLESLSKFQKKESHYKNYNDFEHQFRKRFQHCLLELDSNVKNGEIIKEIGRRYQEIVEEADTSMSGNLMDTYLLEIKNLAEYIKAKGNMQEHLEAANVDLEINEDMTLEEVSNKLTDIIRRLYKIQMNIDERKSKEENVQKYSIDLDQIYMESPTINSEKPISK